MEKSMYYSAYGAILVSISNDVKSITKVSGLVFVFQSKNLRLTKLDPSAYMQNLFNQSTRKVIQRLNGCGSG